VGHSKGREKRGYLDSWSLLFFFSNHEDVIYLMSTTHEWLLCNTVIVTVKVNYNKLKVRLLYRKYSEHHLERLNLPWANGKVWP
jgi:hypothetical protein